MGETGHPLGNPPCPGAGCLPSGPASCDLCKGEEVTLPMPRSSSARLLCMLSTCKIQETSAAFTNQPRGSPHATDHQKKKKKFQQKTPKPAKKKKKKKEKKRKGGGKKNHSRNLLVWKIWHFWHLGFPSLKWQLHA